METVILVSVLSTLGAVAVLTSIVVAFIKLRNKVDVNDFASRIDELERAMIDNNKFLEDKLDKQIDEVYQTIDKTRIDIEHEFEKVRDEHSRNKDDIMRLIDSRCDKLDSKISNLTRVSGDLILRSEKQLLND